MVEGEIDQQYFHVSGALLSQKEMLSQVGERHTVCLPLSLSLISDQFIRGGQTEARLTGGAVQCQYIYFYTVSTHRMNIQATRFNLIWFNTILFLIRKSLNLRNITHIWRLDIFQPMPKKLIL